MHSKTLWFAAILTVLGGPAQAALFESFFNHQADRPPVAGSRPEIAAAAGSEGTWFGRFSGQRFDSFVDSYKPFSARGCFKSELACRIWQQRAITYIDAGRIVGTSCRLGVPNSELRARYYLVFSAGGATASGCAGMAFR
jgi:hypothetical protein